MDKKNISTIIIGISLIISAIFITNGLYNVSNSDRTVTVRGLSEREYDADFAVWPIKFTVAGNDLSLVQEEVTEKIEIVLGYLAQYDIIGNEITVKEPSVTDALTSYYGQKDVLFRYLAEATIFVRSSNIQAVKNALVASLNLVGQGIVLQNEYDSEVQYLFTKLNDVKPEMIAEATKNARFAAEQFAVDSGSKVGKIMTASQGLFSIEDASPGLPEKKTVRVVTNVTYLLND